MGPLSLNLGLVSPKGTLPQAGKQPCYRVSDFAEPITVIDSVDQVAKADVIIDTRSYNSYQQFHLRGAVNVCIPTTLLKRRLMTLLLLFNLVSFPPPLKTLLEKRMATADPKPGDNVKLLFYDSRSTGDSISFNTFHTISKFMAFGRYFDIYLLNGGFQLATRLLGVDVGDASPERDELPPLVPLIFSPASDPASDSSVAATTDSADLGLAGFVLPLATTSKVKFVSLLKKQQVETKGSGSNDLADYHHRFRYPLGTSAATIASTLPNLPPWLGTIVANRDDKDVINDLNHRFLRIEQLEVMRLQLLVERTKTLYHQPSRLLPVCTPLGLCPDCDPTKYEMPKGIEYGYKNRYKNIWPYEHSRVRLGCNSCLEVDDYINANYIDVKKVVPKTQCRYIATQNPMSQTVCDFWRLIHLQKIKIIINLDRNPVTYLNDHDFVGLVKVVSQNDLLIVRLINGEIYHFQYLQWPDFGVPENFDLVLEFIRVKNETMAKLYDGSQRPTVMVHCMAGCGRTGVFITLDTLIDCCERDPCLFKQLEQDLVFQIVLLERTQRIFMVQNLAQYIVCYEMLLWYLDKINRCDLKVPQYIKASTPSLLAMATPKCHQSPIKTPLVSGESGGDYFTFSMM